MARMHREFDPTQVTIDNKLKRGFKIECGRCHLVLKEAVNAAAHGALDSAETVWARRKFEKNGWYVADQRERDDRCPACFKLDADERLDRMKHIIPSPPVQLRPSGASLASIGQAVATSKSATPPVMLAPPAVDIPVMQRDDRRVIFVKLNEVYEGEEVGYGPGWTDARVAKDLGIPRKWVETIREENFGPLKVNSEIVEQINTANEIMARARTLVDAVQAAKLSIQEAMKLIDAQLGPLIAMMDRTQRSIAEIEKAIR